MLSTWILVRVFKKIPHGRLNEKIKMQGIHGDFVVCIQDCLIHSRQGCSRRKIFKLEVCDQQCSGGICGGTSVVCVYK